MCAFAREKSQIVSLIQGAYLHVENCSTQYHYSTMSLVSSCRAHAYQRILYGRFHISSHVSICQYYSLMNTTGPFDAF